MADHADPIAHIERIVQQPLERTPTRMHFDGALGPSVVSVFDVGVAAADMRDDAAILTFQKLEQLVGSVDRLGRGLAFDQDVRRAADWLTLVAVEDVAVPAHASVTGPFVAR